MPQDRAVPAPALGTGAGPEHQIGALWIEGRLSFLEQLCLTSYRSAGHHVVLFHYGPVENVPEGVELADARRILPDDDVLVHERTGSPAPHADRFRYHMLAKLDRTIWADTDAYCVAPHGTKTGHFHGWESDSHVNNGVLALPQDSATLAALLEFTSDPAAIPEWLPPRRQRALEAAKAAGEALHAGQMSWGIWGPQALTHYLKKTGEVVHSLDREVLYPISFQDRRMLLRPGVDLSAMITERTLSVHLYGRRIRGRLRATHGGIPPRRSWLGRALRRHGINPLDAPLGPSARREAAPARA